MTNKFLVKTVYLSWLLLVDTTSHHLLLFKNMSKTKHILTLALLLVSVFVSYQVHAQTAQNAVALENPIVHFFSDGGLEKIESTNKKAIGNIYPDAKRFAFKIPIKQFVFKKALMQDHFNENYMESDKYPEATFAGSIVGDYDLTKDGTYPIKADGVLNVHGVAQKRSIPATITVKNGKASIFSKFIIKLVDHKIDIPTMLFKKIAEEIQVDITSNLK
ncbi:MAG: YceI family protein [Cytophagales bacterium]|nr:MAG: YceI family protein [Cytophagales bacterium]TAF61708.1 MAG: YceI family protein [Cytophagales bacterium]